MSLAQGSQVEQQAGKMVAIESFTKGGPVMAADTNFKWSAYTVADIVATGQTGQPDTVFVTYGKTSLIVTADHPFMVKDGPSAALLTAEKLTSNDKLVAPDGNTVPISEVLVSEYLGAFYNVATGSDNDPKTDMDGHLLNTNGVISGDYMLEVCWKGGNADNRHPVRGDQ